MVRAGGWVGGPMRLGEGAEGLEGGEGEGGGATYGVVINCFSLFSSCCSLAAMRRVLGLKGRI